MTKESNVSLVAVLATLSLTLLLYVIYHLVHMVNPYTKIHSLYIAGIFLILPLILACHWVAHREKIVIPSKVLTFFWIIAACFLLYKSHFLFFPVAHIIHSGYWVSFSLFGILLLMCCFNTVPCTFKQFMYCFLILQIGFLAFRLFMDYAFWFNSSAFALPNFNAVFSSVVQAVHQQLPLVDYYAQYGYYSGLLSLVFRIIPLTLMTYSIVLATLVLVTFIFLFLGLRKVIVNPFLCLIVLMACFYGQFYFAQIVYWAVLPIRLIFPFLGFWLIASYNVNKSSRLYHAIFFIVTLSLTWNIDTGAVLFLSWLLFLSYNVIPSSKAIVKIWLTGFIYVVMLLFLYAAYTWVTRGIFPHYQDIFIFQELFFGHGIASLPMKPFDSWTLLMLIYLVGFVYAFHKKAPMIFFLCLMGVGIFSYFVMRSYFQNIFVVTWPALVLLGMFADAMIAARRFWLAFFAVLPLVLWSLNAVASSLSPAYPPTQKSTKAWRHVLTQSQWIKSLNLEKRNVIFISDNSGIFYMVSNAKSPFLIPGATEIASQTFVDSIVKYAANKKSHTFLLIEPGMPGYSFYIYNNLRKLTKSLPVIKKSSDGTLILYGIHEK